MANGDLETETRNEMIDGTNRDIDNATSPSGVEDVLDGRGQEQRREERQDERREEKPAEPKVGSKFDDKRARIAAEAKARREANEGEKELPIVSPEREKNVFGDEVRTRQDRIDEQRAARGEEPPATAPATRKIKVNGREIELSEDDIIKHASRALAGDDHLETAKAERAETRRLLEEVRSVRAAIPERPAASSETKEAETPAAIPGDAELDSIVDRLQVGEVAEARAALAKYGEIIEERLLNKIGNLDEVVDSRVNAIAENRRRTSEASETWNSFKDGKPEYDKPAFQTAIATEAAVVMRRKLVESGLDDEFIEHVKAQNGLDEPRAVRLIYDEMKKRGTQLPTTGEILAEADKSLFPNRAAPRPATPTPDLDSRRERKDMIRSQPRRAAMPSALENREKSRIEVQREAIHKMRLARGKRR